MLRIPENEIFKIFVNWPCQLTLAFGQEEASSYLVKAQMAYDRVIEKLQNLMVVREMQQNEKMIEKLREKLEKLKLMKLRVEREKEDKKRMKEMERFKRTQLQNYLQSQIMQNRIRKNLERQMNIEQEKELLMAEELKQKQKEKEKLLEEIKKLGKNFDDEIEDILAQRKLREQEAEEERLRLQEEQLEFDSMDSEKEKKLKGKMEEEKNIRENDEEEIPKRKKEKAVQDMEEEDFNVNIKDLKASNLMFQLPEKLNKWMEKKKKREKILEKNKNLIESLAFGAVDPPLGVMFDLCVNKVIRRQAELTNSVLIELFFEKYKLMDVFYLYKQIFMCERGDYAREFMDWVYNVHDEVNQFNLYSINSVFDTFEDERLPDVKFGFSLRQVERFPKLEIITSDVSLLFLSNPKKIKNPLINPKPYLTKS
jgi:hypothetical protein